MTVTAIATSTVRTITVRYVELFTTSRKLSSVNDFTVLPVNTSVLQNDESRRTASAPRYTTTSTSIGAASSSNSRSRGCRCRTLDAPVSCTARPPALDASALDLLPGRRPVAVVLAGGVGATVQALGDRRVPVPDLVEVGLVVGVERVAERLVHRLGAGLAVGRCLTEPLGHLGVHLRADDVVHPLVGTGLVLALGGHHPGVRPAGRALAGQHRLDLHLLVRLDVVGDDLPGGADHRVAGVEGLLRLEVVRPVLADDGVLRLEQV